MCGVSATVTAHYCGRSPVSGCVGCGWRVVELENTTFRCTTADSSQCSVAAPAQTVAPGLQGR